MHVLWDIFKMYLMYLAWDDNYFEITCGVCDDFMENFLWW